MGFDKDIANIKYNFLTTLDKATAKMVDECKREKCFDDIFKDQEHLMCTHERQETVMFE